MSIKYAKDILAKRQAECEKPLPAPTYNPDQWELWLRSNKWERLQIEQGYHEKRSQKRGYQSIASFLIGLHIML